jgi:hypothetical protein
MAIGKQLSDGNPDGTSLGQSVTDLISFFGETPVVQQANIADATNTTTTTSTTTALTTDLDSLRTKFNSLLAKLEALGLLADA